MSDWHWIWEQNIPSDTDAGKRVLNEVVHRLESEGWLQKDIFGVHLAMEEALVNAVKHGNGYDETKNVEIICRMSADRVRIEIQDEGDGFDPDSLPDCTDEEHLEIPSGRGVMLMRTFMSLVEYNDLGNRVIMEKQRAVS